MKIPLRDNTLLIQLFDEWDENNTSLPEMITLMKLLRKEFTNQIISSMKVNELTTKLEYLTENNKKLTRNINSYQRAFGKDAISHEKYLKLPPNERREVCLYRRNLDTGEWVRTRTYYVTEDNIVE